MEVPAGGAGCASRGTSNLAGEAYGNMDFFLRSIWRRRIISVEQFLLVIIGIYEQFLVLIAVM
jgi:hypothetical protein